MTIFINNRIDRCCLKVICVASGHIECMYTFTLFLCFLLILRALFVIPFSLTGDIWLFFCTVKCIKMFQVAKKVFEGAVLCVQTSLSYISFSFSLSCGKWLGQKFTRSLQKKPNRCTCKKRKLICNCYSFVYMFLVLTFVGFLGLSVHLVVLKWINRLFTKLRSQTTLYPHIPLERTNKQN